MHNHGGDIYSCQREVIDFSSNINPLGVPESFRRAVYEDINDFARYPDIKYRALRSVVAEYLDFDSPELVIPGNGAVQIIYKSMRALHISRMINLSPTFSEYALAARQMGVEVIDLEAYDAGFQSLNFDRMLQSLDDHSLVVVCNPNNPTGTFVNKEKLSALAQVLAEKDCFLLIDEAFIEFTNEYPDNSMVSELDHLQNVMIIRAATKFFGLPGIRLGFGISKNRKLVRKIKEQMEPWNVNTAAVLAGCTVYRDQDYISASRKWIKEERDYLFYQLNQIDGLMVYPSTANFYLAKLCNEIINAWTLKELMLRKGFLIRTPDGFHFLTPYHFRLAVKDRRSNEQVVTALQEILSLFS